MDSMIAKLRVALQLDSAAFETGAKRAAAEVNTLGSRAEKAGFAVGSMGKALIAGASAFAALGVVQQLKDAVVASLEYASSLSETSQQLGVTVESLQQFRLLAEQSGVAEETMDKALQKLTRTMGEAAQGGNKQAKLFAELGLSIRDANGHVRTADQLLPEIAGKLAAIASPAERARIEVGLFGKAGQELEPLLGQGEAAIRDFMQQAKDAGIIISKELADKADKAADKIGFLQKKLGMRFTVAVAEHAEEIDRIVTSLSNLVDRFFSLIGAMERFANSPAGKFISQVNDVAQRINPLSGSLRGVGALVDQAGAAPAKPAAGGAPSNPKAFIGAKFGGPLLKSGGTFKPGAGPLANFAGTGIGLGNPANDFGGMAPGQLDHGNYVRSIVDSLAVLNDATDEASSNTKIATVRIGESFADMAEQTIGSLQNLASSIKGGDFLSILGGVVGLFTQLGKIGAFGKTISGRINKVPGFANGTNFAPGGLALVGERGPELVNLPRGSQVYPNGTGPGSGGGGRTSIQVLPSKYFDVHIMEHIGTTAPGIAQAGGDIGFAKVARAGSRRLA